MPTLNQKCNQIHKRKKRKGARARALSIDHSPVKRGIVKKVRIVKPKKPNSAQRKIANVKLSSRQTVNCYIPGLGHNLREYSVVYALGGAAKDLNGTQYHLMRGQLDFHWKEREEIQRVNKLTRRGLPKLDKRDEF
jgi:small subunit ribosomal protein S12